MALGFSASKLLAKMSTDEANAERLVGELCKIPVGKLGGVVCLLEDLVKKIRDNDGSRVTKKVMLLMSLLESSCAVFLPGMLDACSCVFLNLCELVFYQW